MSKILVDLRGKEIEIMKPHIEKMEMNTSIERTFSDFVFIDDDDEVRAIFERKQISDFVSSLGKRMNRQALTMMPYSPASFIVLVGELEDIYMVAKMMKQPFYEGQFFGAIASLAVRDRTSVLWVKNNEQAVKLIDKICKKIEEGKLDNPSFVKKEKDKLRVICLCFSWGIRPKRAKKLLKEFGTIEEIMDASADDFKRLGISKRSWTSMQEFFKEKG